MNIVENNQVTISGKIVSDFVYSHEVFGEKFYTADLSSVRISGKYDIIPIMVSDRLVDVNDSWKEQIVKITGQFRSCNKYVENKNRVILSVFITEFNIWKDDGEEHHPDDENEIFLEGYICKRPIYRKTPLGREIADMLLAVNRPYGKSDYIPCICWGRNACYVSGLEQGTCVKVFGRIQSRTYIKKLDDGCTEERVAYEVSVNKLEVVEDAD